jgi:hypothetical protein
MIWNECSLNMEHFLFIIKKTKRLGFYCHFLDKAIFFRIILLLFSISIFFYPLLLNLFFSRLFYFYTADHDLLG